VPLALEHFCYNRAPASPFSQVRGEYIVFEHRAHAVSQDTRDY